MAPQYQTHLTPLAGVIGKFMKENLSRHPARDGVNVRARAEVLVLGIWLSVMGEAESHEI